MLQVWQYEGLKLTFILTKPYANALKTMALDCAAALNTVNGFTPKHNLEQLYRNCCIIFRGFSLRFQEWIMGQKNSFYPNCYI